MRGRHASLDDLPERQRKRPFARSTRQTNLGFDFPSWTLNSLSMAAFNELTITCRGDTELHRRLRFSSFRLIASGIGTEFVASAALFSTNACCH